MKHTELANDYFARHTLSKECHITSDGRVFHTIGHAMSFAQEHNLKPQTIESYTKNDSDQLEFQERFAPEEKENNKDSENADLDIVETLTFDEALALLNTGNLVKLPEWEGLWFKNIKEDQILVLTKDNEILDNPDESFQERNDWQLVDVPTADQKSALENYFNNIQVSKLKNTDIATAEYSDLKAFAKHFKLETADQKADTLKAALTEFKNSLN